METIDLRRVTEIHFHRSLLQLCVNRGTVGPLTLSFARCLPLHEGRCFLYHYLRTQLLAVFRCML